MSHFKTLCKLCEDVITQCRCPSPDKFIKYDVCDNCVDKFEEAEKTVTETLEALRTIK